MKLLLLSALVLLSLSGAQSECSCQYEDECVGGKCDPAVDGCEGGCDESLGLFCCNNKDSPRADDTCGCVPKEKCVSAGGTSCDACAERCDDAAGEVCCGPAPAVAHAPVLSSSCQCMNAPTCPDDRAPCDDCGNAGCNGGACCQA